MDGKDAVLAADNHEGFEYLVDGKTVKVLSSYEMSAEKGGGSDYANKTVFMFGIGSASESPFSYKFKVDPENKTFALLQRDEYFGKYVSDNMYIFLDGYGTGFISFDSKSYSKTRIRYEVKAGELIVTYFDVLPSFAYGESASFVFDTFGNVLTVRNIEGMNAEGIIFENAFITDGAIVRVKNDVMGAEASLAAEARFFAGIEIITADGTLSEAEKQQMHRYFHDKLHHARILSLHGYGKLARQTHDGYVRASDTRKALRRQRYGGFARKRRGNRLFRHA